MVSLGASKPGSSNLTTTSWGRRRRDTRLLHAAHLLANCPALRVLLATMHVAAPYQAACRCTTSPPPPTHAPPRTHPPPLRRFAAYLSGREAFQGLSSDPSSAMRPEWAQWCEALHDGWEYRFWDEAAAVQLLEEASAGCRQAATPGARWHRGCSSPEGDGTSTGMQHVSRRPRTRLTAPSLACPPTPAAALPLVPAHLAWLQADCGEGRCNPLLHHAPLRRRVLRFRCGVLQVKDVHITRAATRAMLRCVLGLGGELGGGGGGCALPANGGAS